MEAKKERRGEEKRERVVGVCVCVRRVRSLPNAKGEMSKTLFTSRCTHQIEPERRKTIKTAKKKLMIKKRKLKSA